MTKAQVNAVTEEMIGTMRSISDTDTLVVATHDPESRAAGAAYIASRKHRERQQRRITHRANPR